ncbi:hypothetical protein, partial [Thermoactinomyces intermedius]|uniref:hypothetical protein n=1 Tax=Thermoactinomyces intermedius TaxID=2024 RepID=UPI001C68B929
KDCVSDGRSLVFPHCQFVIAKAFYPLLPEVSLIPFHGIRLVNSNPVRRTFSTNVRWLPDTLGRIIAPI